MKVYFFVVVVVVVVFIDFDDGDDDANLIWLRMSCCFQRFVAQIAYRSNRAARPNEKLDLP